MNSENFIKFVNYFKIYARNSQVNPKSVDDYYPVEVVNNEYKKAQAGQEFLGHIKEMISKAKVFQIEDSVKKLLIMSKTPITNDELNMPFNEMFLDVSFKKDELADIGITIDSDEIVGILVNYAEFMKLKTTFENPELEKAIQRGEVRGKGLRITTLSVSYNTYKGEHKEGSNEMFFSTFNRNVSINKGEANVTIKKVKEKDKKADDFCYKFLLNFINFVNTPDVLYVEHKPTEKNMERRLKEGKIPIPSSCVIKITGTTRRYLDDIDEQYTSHRQFGYRFDIRGYYRFLRNPKFKNKINQLVWVKAHQKGKGIYVKKSYDVDNSEVGK